MGGGLGAEFPVGGLDLQREHKKVDTEEANSKLLQGEAWQQVKRRHQRTAVRWFVKSGGMT